MHKILKQFPTALTYGVLTYLVKLLVVSIFAITFVMRYELHTDLSKLSRHILTVLSLCNDNKCIVIKAVIHVHLVVADVCIFCNFSD